MKDTLILVQIHRSESEFVPQPKGCEVPNIQGAPSGKAPAEEDPLEVNVRAAAASDSRDGRRAGCDSLATQQAARTDQKSCQRQCDQFSVRMAFVATKLVCRQSRTGFMPLIPGN